MRDESVPGDMRSLSATSRLDAPSTSKLSVSLSRGVSGRPPAPPASHLRGLVTGPP